MTTESYLPTIHVAESPLDETFPLPKPAPSAEPSTEVWTRGEGEWDLGDPPEDLAFAPSLIWNEETRRLVVEALRRARAQWLEEGQFVDVTWPSEASLWREGHTFWTDPDQCDEHGDEMAAGCEECAALEPEKLVVEPAEWHWYVYVETWERDDRGGVDVVDSFHEHIMSTTMDPRGVAYAEAWQPR